jgi:hypothetical protein
VTESIIKPLRLNGDPWARMPDLPPQYTFGYECEVWKHTVLNLGVMSAVEVASDKDGIDRGPEYHISISKHDRGQPRRCTSDEARYVLKAFGLEGAEEDNHVPNGVVRNFWRTVAEPMIGLECACKADEPAMVEDKGDFVWRP